MIYYAVLPQVQTHGVYFYTYNNGGLSYRREHVADHITDCLSGDVILFSDKSAADDYAKRADQCKNKYCDSYTSSPVLTFETNASDLALQVSTKLPKQRTDYQVDFPSLPDSYRSGTSHIYAQQPGYGLFSKVHLVSAAAIGSVLIGSAVYYGLSGGKGPKN